MDEFLVNMGRRIAEQRRRLGLTQEELAERAGMASQNISTAELGKKALRPGSIVKLSRALGISTDYLLTGQRNVVDYAAINEKLGKVSPQEYDKIMRMIDILLEK